MLRPETGPWNEGTATEGARVTRTYRRGPGLLAAGLALAGLTSGLGAAPATASSGAVAAAPKACIDKNAKTAWAGGEEEDEDGDVTKYWKPVELPAGAAGTCSPALHAESGWFEETDGRWYEVPADEAKKEDSRAVYRRFYHLVPPVGGWHRPLLIESVDQSGAPQVNPQGCEAVTEPVEDPDHYVASDGQFSLNDIVGPPAYEWDEATKTLKPAGTMDPFTCFGAIGDRLEGHFKAGEGGGLVRAESGGLNRLFLREPVPAEGAATPKYVDARYLADDAGKLDKDICSLTAPSGVQGYRYANPPRPASGPPRAYTDDSRSPQEGSCLKDLEIVEQGWFIHRRESGATFWEPSPRTTDPDNPAVYKVFYRDAAATGNTVYAARDLGIDIPEQAECTLIASRWGGRIYRYSDHVGDEYLHEPVFQLESHVRPYQCFGEVLERKTGKFVYSTKSGNWTPTGWGETKSFVRIDDRKNNWLDEDLLEKPSK
ncbi:hypothetical protein [Streptomyces sp. NBC_01304]|uniref:hypothetical protein n=1 Tax=Streptomyces sp. NBC_01304 TaxID=2903818 RepID=UPI002E0F999D|nr:hypothetical protein OG430_00865 [Streptomyces sp. NBC_01304]